MKLQGSLLALHALCVGCACAFSSMRASPSIVRVPVRHPTPLLMSFGDGGYDPERSPGMVQQSYIDQMRYKRQQEASGLDPEAQKEQENQEWFEQMMEQQRREDAAMGQSNAMGASGVGGARNNPMPAQGKAWSNQQTPQQQGMDDVKASWFAGQEKGVPGGGTNQMSQRDMASTKPASGNQSSGAGVYKPSDKFRDAGASPEMGLAQVATHTLETMARTLEQNPSVQIPVNERAALVNAMKRVMDALAKSAASE